MSKRVAILTGTRADYGIYRPVLTTMRGNPNLEPILLVTGMHLNPDHGLTLKDIVSDGYQIGTVLGTRVPHGRTGAEMADFIGTLILGLTQELQQLRPDVLLVLGDRGEMLAAALVAAHLSIPIAHLHGGEISGNLDHVIRYCISLLAHLHLVATVQAQRRLVAMGEEPGRVIVVGAPAVDTILSSRRIARPAMIKRLAADPGGAIVVVQHPETTKMNEAGIQMQETMAAVTAFDRPIFIILPNNDAGSRDIVRCIESYEDHPNVHVFRSLDHVTYINLLRHTAVLVGNSSSGIIESAALRLPVVNIGVRQQGRERGSNVLDVPFDRSLITDAVDVALHDSDFLQTVATCDNPYGDGQAGPRVAEAIDKMALDRSLLQKGACLW